MLTKAAEDFLAEYTPQGAAEVAVPMTLPGTPTDHCTTASNNVAIQEAGAADFGPDCDGGDNCCTSDGSCYGAGFKEGFRTAFEMFHPETVVKEAMCACGKDESQCHCPTEYTGDQPVNINKKTEHHDDGHEAKAPTDGPMEMANEDDANISKKTAQKIAAMWMGR